MHLLVLPNALHGGELHSIDIDSSNSKLLTAGKDGTISVWELIKLTNLKNRKDIVDAKPEKTLRYHEDVISIAKWCPTDRELFISCDKSGKVYIVNLKDDTTKLVYPLSNLESPSTNAIDGSWSPDGKLFAWSTSDGKVHIYDHRKNTYQDLTNLNRIDKNIIQRSLAFDPSNNFLVTLGDDTLIYVYQFQEDPTTKNYQFRLIQKNSKLLNKTPLNVRYKRISWSADGEHLSVPTAIKNQTSLVSLISRSESWANKVSLVGHDVNCEVVKFSPKIYSSAPDSLSSKSENGIQPGDTKNSESTKSEVKETSISETTEKDNIEAKTHKGDDKKDADGNEGDGNGKSSDDPGNVFNIIATAGSDRTLVVWNTSKDSPVFVIKDIVSKAILDLCWDKSGTVLFLAAADGSLAVVTFEPFELGTEISTDLYQELKAFESESIKPFDHKYDTNSTSARRGAENQQIEILDQKDAIVVDSAATSNSFNGKSSQDSSGNKAEKVAAKKQSTQITPEILPAPSLDEASSHVQDILQSTMSNRQLKSAKTAPISTKQKNTSKQLTPTTDSAHVDNQKITTKNGKRRIQPMLISKTGESNGGVSQPTSNGGGSLSKSSAQIGSLPSSSKSLMEFDKPSYSVSEEIYKEKKRLKASQDDQSQKKFKRDLEPIKFIGSIVVNPSITFAKVRLAVPKVRLNFRTVSKSSPSNENPYVLDIRNGQGNETTPTRITFFKKDKQLWCDFVPRYIQLVSEGSEFWALSTADGQILTYSAKSGKRLLPPMIIGAPISFLESHGKFLMAITSVGELYVWNLEEKKIHLRSPSSLSPLLDLSSKFLDDGLTKSENLTMCSITSLGVPLVTLSNGSGYLFNKDMGTWQTITESWWAFGSHYWDSLGNDDSSSKPQALSVISGEDKGSIVGLLEHRTNEEILRKTRAGRSKYFNKISKNMIMKEGFENLENTISLSHLENRILCCELLGEFNDFKKFLITYAKRICELGFKAKLFEICNQLLGPLSDESDSEEEEEYDADDKKDKSNPSWDPKICGLDKHELLKEIVLVCASNRDAQRILIHFGKKLGILEDELN